MYKSYWFCRWCGVMYNPEKQTERDGFCTDACKQAHYRAYRKYVTLRKAVQRIRKSVQRNR